ncbi:MAG: PD40 domain-containing protein, partial [Flavobacteriales bacterium]|nr:PD40 domain-containing protein [Flavobacteriales bacterium]
AQNNLKEAIEFKERVLQINPYYSSNELYYIGSLAISIGDYKKSLKFSELFLRAKSSNDFFRDEARRNAENSVFAMEALKHPVKYEPKNMGSNINTERPEYFPTLTADDKTLLFTRNIKDDRVPRYGAQEDFFVTTWNGSEWSKGISVGPPINTQYNEGAPTYSADGRYVIFVGCETGYKGEFNYGEGREGYGSCDLFASERIGEKWSKPFNLGKPVNSGHWESQPCFSADGKSLYFIRGIIRGGRKNPGEQDIYVTEITDNGTWSVPEKISNKVNTPYQEESVMIHPDGQTLYFSSNGHPGMGGLDIYVSRRDANGEWQTPVNLGYPINTYSNENSLLVSAKGSLAFFASDREGGMGSLDLYTFELPNQFRPIKTTNVKGKVFDAVTKKHLAAHFKLIDLETGEVVKEAFANSGNGEFLVALPINKNYALHADHEGYLFYSQNYSLTQEDLKDKEFVIEVPMNKGLIVLENVFFDVNKSILKPESVFELDRVVDYLMSNPEIKVELGGHTDSDGEEKDNQILSENRAKACVDYITSKGIDSSRMSHHGYGESEPRVKNDTKEHKAMNRRTEMKIIK